MDKRIFSYFLLSNQSTKFAGLNYTFQQDNALNHSAKFIKIGLKIRLPHSIDRPIARNAMKNVWGITMFNNLWN